MTMEGYCKECNVLEDLSNGICMSCTPTADIKETKEHEEGIQVFNNLTVLREVRQTTKYKKRVLCRCVCGRAVTVNMTDLKTGNTKSCGCLKEAWMKSGNMNRSHGKSHLPIYGVWSAMIQRCTNPNSTQYYKYGAEGVTVCPEWLTFEPFYKWSLANGWKPNLSIDREDGRKEYSPGNCRWVTLRVQAINQKVNSRNTSGFPGVGRKKNGKQWKWLARININGRRKHIGYYNNKEEAITAWINYVEENNLDEYRDRYKYIEGIEEYLQQWRDTYKTVPGTSK